MSIVHDAYLFNPQPFALTLVDHARCLVNDDRQGYRGLRAAAIQSFDENALTRELADQYGGWDRAAILDELTEQDKRNADAVAFCYLLLLYGHLVPPLPQNSLGLCTSWRACAKSLERMGWHNGETDLLIKGHSFEFLAEKYGPHDVESGFRIEEIGPVWRRILPASTGGSAGWLELADVETLLKRLEGNHVKLQSASSTHETQKSEEHHALQRAETMLATARTSQTGLCLVLSG